MDRSKSTFEPGCKSCRDEPEGMREHYAGIHLWAHQIGEGRGHTYALVWLKEQQLPFGMAVSVAVALNRRSMWKGIS